MIAFSHLNNCQVNGEDIIQKIKHTMLGNLKTLQEVGASYRIYEKFYVIGRFLGKDSSNLQSVDNRVLTLKFCENKQQFVVVCYLNLAERLSQLINQERLSIGDYVSLIRPQVTNQSQNIIQLEVPEEKYPTVIIWKNSTLYWTEPFLLHLCYHHLIFYKIYHTGSLGQAESNLVDLVSAYGHIRSLNKIAGTCGRYVALAKYTKLLSPLIENSKNNAHTNDVHIQVKFDEFLLESQQFYTTTFSTFFCGLLAVEIEKAVKVNDLECNDLVAFVNPSLKRRTAAPIDLEFSSSQETKLIILKNQYKRAEVNSSVNNSDMATIFQRSKMKIQNLADFTPLDIYPITIQPNEDCTLSEMCRKLQSLSQVTTLNILSKDTSQSQKNGIIIAYFLRLIMPIRNKEKHNKVTVLLREICTDCKYGPYIKLVLHLEFAQPFCLAVKRNVIVPGDIFGLVNPVLFKNPKYAHSGFESEPDYLIEMALPEKQSLLVFKVNETAESMEFQTDQLTVEARNVNGNCEKNIENNNISQLLTNGLESNRRENLSRGTIIVNHSAIGAAVCEDSQPADSDDSHKRCSCVVEKTFDGENHMCPIFATEPATDVSLGKFDEQKQRMLKWLKITREVCNNSTALNTSELYSQIAEKKFIQAIAGCIHFNTDPSKNPIFLLEIKKPIIKNTFDLISGFCLPCNQMFPYVSLKVANNESDTFKSLCPKCLKHLKLEFCLEIKARVQEKDITVIMKGVEAEKFLNITCEKFLTSDKKCRLTIVKRLLNKLKENRAGRGTVIESKDVTFWYS